jgi:hypothetical protein
VARIAKVAAARDATTHYRNAELVLSEWGPDLNATAGDEVYASSMAPPLHAGTVLARGASLGLARAHHAIFYDYFPGMTWGLVTNAGAPRPVYHAYALLAPVVADGAQRLSVRAFPDGALDAGSGAVLVSATGTEVRVFLVNRGTAARTARVDLPSGAATPGSIRVFDDPARPPLDVAPTGALVTIPPSAIALLRLPR